MVLQIGNPMVAIDRRRGDVEQAKFSQGGVIGVSYIFPFVGPGEAYKDVSFPVWFVEPPVLTSSGEIDKGSNLVAGNYPWCSAMAGGWVTQVKGGATYYLGCRVIIVVGGAPGQTGAIHFGLRGKALQGPVT